MQAIAEEHGVEVPSAQIAHLAKSTAEPVAIEHGVEVPSGKIYHLAEKTAESIAAEHGVSAKTVRNAADFAKQVDAITEHLGEDVRPIILSGNEGLTRQEISEVASAAARLRDATRHQKALSSSAPTKI